MKRLFISINLDEEIKNQIAGLVRKMDKNFKGLDSSFRWIGEENWHLTITFLGYEPDEAITPIIDAIKQTAAGFKAPVIEFEKIIWGPPEKTSRMIWIVAINKTSKILGGLKGQLENNLIQNKVRFKTENRDYNAHLTLSRFDEGTVSEKQFKLPAIEPISFQSDGLNLVESVLKRNGAEYTSLAKIRFNG